MQMNYKIQAIKIIYLKISSTMVTYSNFKYSQHFYEILTPQNYCLTLLTLLIHTLKYMCTTYNWNKILRTMAYCLQHFQYQIYFHAVMVVDSFCSGANCTTLCSTSPSTMYQCMLYALNAIKYLHVDQKCVCKFTSFSTHMELNVPIVLTHINISMEKTHLHKHCYSEWMYTCTYLACVYFGEYLCRTSYVFKANLSSRNIHKMINIVKVLYYV